MKLENKNEIIIYQTEDGKTKLDVRMEHEAVWLTQLQIARLYGRDRSVITKLRCPRLDGQFPQHHNDEQGDYYDQNFDQTT